ncbi:hypothetical protein VULLAG_LOCUS12043 [Vulpes lagopus]
MVVIGQLGDSSILSQLCSSLQATGSSSEAGWAGSISIAYLSAGRSDRLEPFSWSLICQLTWVSSYGGGKFSRCKRGQVPRYKWVLSQYLHFSQQCISRPFTCNH